MRAPLVALRSVWVRLTKFQAVRQTVLAGLVVVLTAGGTACVDPGKVGMTSREDEGALEDAIGQASPGATVIVQPGEYRVSNLEVPANITLYAPEGASIVGNMIVRGPGTVIRGFTFLGGMIDLTGSDEVSVGDCVFKSGSTAIKIDNASGAFIINNEFRGIAGGVVTGWALDRSTISGNHFFDCGQCINLTFTNNRLRGRGIVIERNIFKGTARMPVEVGPIGAYTEDLVVRDNWAEDFRNRGPDPGDTMSTFVAYSLVPTNGVNTVITGNYAIAGVHGRGDIGIELAGSGEIAGNHIEDFRYGAIVYGADFHVHDNGFVNTTEAVVLNYAKRQGRIAPHQTAARTMRRPERRMWP